MPIRIINLLLLLSLTLTGIPNSSVNAQTQAKLDGGFGFGLDYGGFLGAKVSYLPIEYLGLSGSFGWYYYTLGFNVGAQMHFLPKHVMNPYVSGMYGANAGLETEVFITRKIYLGPSFGIGVEISPRTRRPIFYNLAFIAPLRKDQFHDDVSAFESQGLVVHSSDWPVTISLGIHLAIETSSFWPPNK